MTQMFPLPWEEVETLLDKPLTMDERKERINKILNQK